MSLKEIAEETTAALLNTFKDCNISEEQKKAVQIIVNDSLVQAVEQARIVHKEATVVCCGPEADMAHKIEYEAKQKLKLLLTNLSSLR